MTQIDDVRAGEQAAGLEEVDMGIDQTGDHPLVLRRYGGDALGHLHLGRWTDPHDPAFLDQDGPVLSGGGLGRVDDAAADDREISRLARSGGKDQQRGGCQLLDEMAEIPHGPSHGVALLFRSSPPRPVSVQRSIRATARHDWSGRGQSCC